ncbi:transcriptional regulator SgrR [Tatumella morbirosei]|uniref:Transcriptional regulator SgrR n=1 Tax=Tatumella morbirosei TaxID=642227 RepID=A0A095T1G3_9GAMM|nr:HTH-type transcriptional regulator SgrR [Tatumella morbirosei]KGD70567.1 transcriptional regulator SgrR [Tatumella morbirosei]
MTTKRLKEQFIRLWELNQGQDQQTNLAQLAEQLHCSTRHIRNLLNRMQQQQWLRWESHSGRGKRSALYFQITAAELRQQQAEALLEQEQTEQLLQLTGVKSRVKQIILARLGRSFRQGRHILRVPYYRPLLSLLPGSPLRRSETHIARQIFNGLLRVDERSGEAVPDIAHHWQQLSPLHWRFYIRPAVHFHHGRELHVTDIITSLQRLTCHPLFCHLKSINSPAAWIVDIHLISADERLPWLLGSVAALILPAEWRTMPDFSSKPSGTGPYFVVENQRSQLRIEAFDDYFGYRPLIDNVTIWVLPEISEDLVYRGLTLQGNGNQQTAGERKLEDGCYFILFDERSAVAQQSAVRRWLSNLLNPEILLQQAPSVHQRFWSPARGMLPEWQHTQYESLTEKPASLTQLTICWYGSHIEHLAIMKIVSPLLARHGIRLICKEVTYQQWFSGDATADLWLGSCNFTAPLDWSVFAQICEIPLFHHCLGNELTLSLPLWHQKKLNTEQWYRKLHNHHRLLPLFHHWLTLQGQRSMRGIRMNSLGWFDFKSAWFVPPEL